MSGIFGIFNRNGNSVDKKIVNNMLEAMSGWEPDESSLRIDGPIALVHAMLWNTPESKYEHLPLHKDTYILTMDARIDNRDELAKELELPDRPMSEIGDSEFILGAYQKWGEECPKRLLGDFAFAIWDEEKEQLFCARDHIGIKLFYFFLSDDLFIFSNDMEGILSSPNIPKDFDDKIISIFLKDHGVHTQKDTFFKKIKKLPPASTLIVKKNEITENTYWKIENCPSVSYSSSEEYIQELKKLYENAIDVRMRTIFPMASHLSGGIDSSPIAVYAARKLQKKNQKLYAYNWINIPDSDEEYEYEAWHFSREISETENIIHEEFKIEPQDMIEQIKKHNIFTKGTMYYWEEYYVQEKLEKLGARTLLSGWGGDELISHNGRSYLEGLFAQKKIMKGLKYLLYEKKHLEYSWIKFLKRILRIFYSLIMTKYSKKKNIDDSGEFDYYKFTTLEYKKFMESHKTEEFPDVVGVRNRQLAMYHYGHLQNRIESWALSGYSKKIEYRYPLLDKRIVEFAIGIPEECYFPKKGMDRHLIRSVILNFLPVHIASFPKANETKINKSLKRFYFESYKIMKKDFKNTDCKSYNKNYVDCEKIKKLLISFDPENKNTYDLGNIVPTIMLLNSMKNL